MEGVQLGIIVFAFTKKVFVRLHYVHYNILTMPKPTTCVLSVIQSVPM